MQPTLVITVPAVGMIYVNGRFLGEASPDAPLFAPVHPFGAVYLEYRPLEPGYLPMARKFVLSSGLPMKDSLPEDLFAILWPGGVSELELSPVLSTSETTEALMLDTMPCKIIRSEHSRLEINGISCPFPRTADTPRLRRINGAAVLFGADGDEQYILTLTPDLSRQTGFIRGDRLEFDASGILRAYLFRDDIAGHGTLERWRLDASGLSLMSTESVWADGAPRIPATPEETALAAVEAALMGKIDEAESYLSSALRARHPLDAIGDLCSLCLPNKYGVPGQPPSIGLVRVEAGSCASVRPMFFNAERTQDRWLLTQISIES